MAMKKKAASAPPAKRAAPKGDTSVGRPPGADDRQPTVKQARFVQAYLETGNASESYRQAYGVGSKSQQTAATEAHRLLQIPHVAHMVATEREKLSRTHGINTARIVQELVRIALADVSKVMDWSGEEVREEQKNGKVVIRGRNEVVLKGSKDLDADTRAAISEVTQTKDGVRVKFHDKAAAIAQLTRIAGLLDEPPETAVTITIRDMRAERGGSE
jgi:phage terminase small subunit